MPGGGGGTGGGRCRFHRLWDPPRPGHCLQAPRVISLGGRRRLTSGVPKPAEGMAEVGEGDAGLEQGGGGCPYLGPNILGGGSSGPVVRVVDLGDDAMHQKGFGWIITQGGP